METPSSSFSYSQDDVRSWAGRFQNDVTHTDFSNINTFGSLAQFLAKNFSQMTVVHQETSRILLAHNEQFKEVKRYVDEVSQANRNEVNRLKHEVNHFREQCNIRFRALEEHTSSSSITALGAAGPPPTDNPRQFRASTAAPHIDGPFQFYSEANTIQETILPVVVNNKGIGINQKKNPRKPCPYCGKLLKKSYLWKHKKYHCNDAKDEEYRVH